MLDEKKQIDQVKAQLLLTGLLIVLPVRSQSEVLQSNILHRYSGWYCYSGGTAGTLCALASDKELPPEKAKQIIDD